MEASHCQEMKGVNGKTGYGVCDHCVLARTPWLKKVEFRDLVGVAIAPVSKNLPVKYITQKE